MKRLRKILDSVGPRIKDGKLARFYPLFQMLDNLLYAGTDRTAHPPFGRDPLDVKRYMFLVIVAAMPAFYHRPKTIADLVDMIVGRVLDHLGIENTLFDRWGKNGGAQEDE